MSNEVTVALISTLGLVAVALISHPRKRLKAIDERTARELENNHGSSMKDDVDGMAYAIHRLDRGLDLERQRVNTVLAIAAIHHPQHAEMYLALRSNHDEGDTP